MMAKTVEREPCCWRRLGHYSLTEPELLARNAVCLDYSVVNAEFLNGHRGFGAERSSGGVRHGRRTVGGVMVEENSTRAYLEGLSQVLGFPRADAMNSAVLSALLSGA